MCAWMVLSVAASSSLGPTSEQVRASRGFPLLDQVLAGPGGALLDDARELLATIDVPSLPFNPATLPPVEDPSNVEVSKAAAGVARDSVVRVSTTSTRCGSSSLGSGVVVSPGRVATNAHVVAGAGRITVGSANDRANRGARLVYLDPANDIAILHVPGLESPVPRWVAEAPRGMDAVVAGYPGGGPLTLGEARVRGQILVADDQGSGSREVHVFRGLVRPGNSGGALLDLDGSVLGLVFANAQDDDQTGFALTEAEVRTAIEATRNATDEVSSGACRAL
jgi:S1-C subfamily serine protease